MSNIPESGLREALAWAKDQGAASRSAILKAPDGSGRFWLFDDRLGKYEAQDVFHQTGRTVSNVEAFAALVAEILTRQDRVVGGEPQAARGASVLFTSGGATFRPNDHDPRIEHHYQRTLDTQWTLLRQLVGKPLEHLPFVRALQGLRPSIPGYVRVIQDFRKIEFQTSSSLRSNPFLEEGKAGMAFTFELETKGGVTQTHIPNTVEFATLFSRGSSKRYTHVLELDVTVKDDGPKKVPVFTLQFPDISAVEDQAVADEISFFRAAMREGFEELLILTNL